MQPQEIIGACFPNTAQLLQDLSAADTEDAAMDLFMRNGLASVTEVVLVLRQLVADACLSNEHEAAEDGRRILNAWESLGDLITMTATLEEMFGSERSDFRWKQVFGTYQIAAETMVTGIMRGICAYAPSDN